MVAEVVTPESVAYPRYVKVAERSATSEVVVHKAALL
jgi:hypothetical protein